MSFRFSCKMRSSKNLARYSLHGFGSSNEWAHVRRYGLQRRGHGEDPKSAIPLNLLCPHNDSCGNVR